MKKLLRDDDRRLQLTANVNTALTDTINLVGVLQWDQRFGEFIRRVDKELRGHYEGANIHFSIVRELDSAIDHFVCEAVTATEYTVAMRSRLEVQLNLVRTHSLLRHRKPARETKLNADGSCTTS